MKRPSVTSLLTVAGISAAAGIAVFELYYHPRLRRTLKAQTYDVMAMALTPLQQMTRISKKKLGQRFGAIKDALRDTESNLSRAERNLRDEAEANRMAAMVRM